MDNPFHYISATQIVRTLLCALCTLTVVAQQGTEDAARLSAITSFLDQYTRPFTILSIGPWNDTIQHIAQSYDCVCVICPCPHQYPYLSATTQHPYSNLHNVVVLGTSLGADTLRKLGECEHFDVTLVLNPIHSFDNISPELINSIAQLGDFTMIELSSRNASKIAKTKNPVSLANLRQKKTQLYLLKGTRKNIFRKTWVMIPLTEKTHKIESSFSEKKLIKRTGQKPPYSYRTTLWLPGIDLVTFKMCRGIYPTGAMIKDAMTALESIEHPDWMVNNMIIQGDKLTFIDFDDADYTFYLPFRPAMKALFHKFIDLQLPQEISNFFWSTLVPAWRTTKGMARGLRAVDQWTTRYTNTAPYKKALLINTASKKAALNVL